MPLDWNAFTHWSSLTPGVLIGIPAAHPHTLRFGLHQRPRSLLTLPPLWERHKPVRQTSAA